MTMRTLTAAVLALTMIATAFSVASFGARSSQGDADVWGYSWVDSKEPDPRVAFEWAEVSATGADAGLSGEDNDFRGPFPIGFTFEFYGSAYTEFYVSSNGFISFGAGSTGPLNYPIPTSSVPNNFIAPFWEDLCVDYDLYNTGAVYYQTVGASPDSRLVVEFHEVSLLESYDLLTFEVILDETGEIWFQYLSMGGETGEGATIGMEDALGYIGSEYSFDEACVEDGLAIMFSLGPVGFGPDQSGLSPKGMPVKYQLGLRNGQASPDTFDIHVESDLGWDVQVFDSSSVNPLTDTDADGTPDTGVVGPGVIFTVFASVTPPTTFDGPVETTLLTAVSDADASVYDNVTLTTQVNRAEFGTATSDQGVDSDGDALFDYLAVSVPLDVVVEDDFLLDCYLRDASAVTIAGAYIERRYEPGAVTEVVQLPGCRIYDHGVDGPYSFEAYLYDSDGYCCGLLLWSTASYSYDDFDPPGASLDGTFTDSAVDTDADTLYDYLTVRVGVDVFEEGYYTLEASLEGTSKITSVYSRTYLASGSQVCDLTFFGWDISGSLQDGPYYCHVQLFNGSRTETDSSSHFTSTYFYDKFEGPPLTFVPPCTDSGVDDDGDSLFESLELVAPVSCTSTAEFGFEAHFMASDGEQVNNVRVDHAYMVSGSSTGIEFVLSAYDIRLEDVGSYVVIEAYDAYDGLLASTTHSIDYSVDDFEALPARFDPPHTSYGLDEDDDSLYDYLVIEAAVEVYLTGEYRISAGLSDGSGSWLHSEQVLAYLGPGDFTAVFRFPGWLIYEQGTGWYCVAMMSLWYEGDFVESETHDIGFVDPADYAPPPLSFSPPHSDRAVDLDGDSLFDYLVVSASVDVVSERDFVFYASLWDDGGWLVGYAVNSTHLTPGAHEVDLMFDAWKVAASIGDPADVSLEAHDTEYNIIDVDSHTPGVYDWAAFDPDPPAISSGWAYDAPTVDGSLGDDEWSGAGAVEFTDADPVNQLSGMLMVMNDADTLYVCLDMTGDPSDNFGDYAQLVFDTGNDEVATDGHEDGFIIEATDTVVTTHLVYSLLMSDWTEHCSPFDDTLTDHDGLAGAMGMAPGPDPEGSHRVYEISIPLALLLASPGDTLGLDAIAYGEWTSEFSEWPAFTDSSPRLEAFGDLELATEPPLTEMSVLGDEGDEGWYVGPVSVTLTVTGGTGGIEATMYRLDGGDWETYTAPFAVSVDGAHTIEYYSSDGWGNDEPVRTGEVKIDATPPTAEAALDGESHFGSWYVSAVTVQLSAEDPVSGVAVIEYSLDLYDWVEWAGTPFVLSEDGQYTVSYRATDVAGNAGPVLHVSMSIDTAPPVTVCEVDGSTVTLVATDSLSGVFATSYRLDDGAWVVYSGPFEVGAGDHTVEFMSVDNAGNEEALKTETIETEGAFNLEWWMVLMVGVLLIMIAVGAIFGMRRRAKEADARHSVKDIGTAMSQMMDDTGDVAPKKPPPPSEEEPPPPE